jgi:nucleoside-diphosphate-sugar epimerase
VDKIIYASSVSIYPMSRQMQSNCWLREDDVAPYDPEGGYGWGKLMGEMQLQWLCKDQPIRAAVLRFFNAYGINENLDETGHVVSALIRRALLHPQEKFVVWGDGNQKRGLLYVDDAVDAILASELRGCSNPPTILNISSDDMVSVRDLAAKIIAISGKPIVPTFDTSKPTGAISRGADISRAKQLLNWHPSTSLDEGLARTYSWAKRTLQQGG